MRSESQRLPLKRGGEEKKKLEHERITPTPASLKLVVLQSAAAAESH